VPLLEQGARTLSKLDEIAMFVADLRDIREEYLASDAASRQRYAAGASGGNVNGGGGGNNVMVNGSGSSVHNDTTATAAAVGSTGMKQSGAGSRSDN
jgi:hypothetical protein